MSQRKRDISLYLTRHDLAKEYKLSVRYLKAMVLGHTSTLTATPSGIKVRVNALIAKNTKG